MVTILGIRATFNQHMAYITPRSETLQPGFLMWSLVHFYDALRELSNENGSTKGGLTCQSLKRFRVPLPPPDAQKQIIEDLKSKIAAIDLLVMKAKEFIVLARERRSALITAAVTGKIDVRGAV
jgi:type I restriction enzyme S subunit